mgnify:CR=1 FL=1|nr:MAG TPA: hypothetical protein [Caudoviricetes sp.]
MGKKITCEQVEEVAELVNQWATENLEPDSGVAVITVEKCKDGTAKVVASSTAVKSSSVTWENLPSFLDKEPYTQLKVYGMEHPVILETKPELVNLSHMWHVFETLNYLSQKVREDLEYAVSRNETVKPVSWVCLSGISTGANVPGGTPRKVLENIFLAHVYSFLRQVVIDNRGMSPLVSRGVNRPEITGLSKLPKVVRAGDGRSVRGVLGAVALELSVRGVELDDGFQESILVDLASAKASEIAVDKAAKYWE